VHINTATHTHKYSKTYTHKYKHTQAFTNIDSGTMTHFYIHTYIHTYMHAFMHAQGIPRIPFSALAVEDSALAAGSFKTVYRATWRGDGDGDGDGSGVAPESRQVAVLVLRHGSAVQEISVFERLGRHPHLVKLLAVSSQPPGNDVCMVLEFAQRGSLDCVLQELEEQDDVPSNAVLLTAAGQVCCCEVSVLYVCDIVCV
jgi:hypothetical protein